MDETCLRIEGVWKYPYRAVDKLGATVDFLLTARRDRRAALRFLRKAAGKHGVPQKITVAGIEIMHMIRKGQPGSTGTASSTAVPLPGRIEKRKFQPAFKHAGTFQQSLLDAFGSPLQTLPLPEAELTSVW